MENQIQPSKKWYLSRIFWLEVFTIAVGITVLFQQQFPEVGFLIALRGSLGLVLRFLTTTTLIK